MFTLTYSETSTTLPEGQQLKLGRSTGNDIVCDDTSASRIHAELRVEGGQLTFRDLESTNGTNVNGAPIQPWAWQILGEGDTIEIGDWVATVGTNEKASAGNGEAKIPRPIVDPSGPVKAFETTQARAIPPELLGG